MEIADIHIPFARWCDERGIPYHRNRPDKRTTAIKGDPDFLLTWCSYCVYIECKVPGRKLSKDQEKRIAYLRKAGNKVAICYSVQDCIEAAQGVLCQSGHKNDVAGRTESQDVAYMPKSDEAIDAFFKQVVARTTAGSAYEIPVIRKPEPPTQNTIEGQKESPSEPAPLPCFIASFGGQDCVFLPTPSPAHPLACRLLRTATQYDLLNIPRR